MIGPVVAAALVALQVVAALRTIEAWPFSAYEMYSHDWRVETVATYRVRLVLADGGAQWWQPQLGKDKQAFSVQFAALAQGCKDAEQFGLGVLRLLERLVVSDLVDGERPPDRYRRIQVLERRVAGGQAGLTIEHRLAFSALVGRPRSAGA